MGASCYLPKLIVDIAVLHNVFIFLFLLQSYLPMLAMFTCCIYSKDSKNVHIFAKKSAEDRKIVHASSKGEAQGRAMD